MNILILLVFVTVLNVVNSQYDYRRGQVCVYRGSTFRHGQITTLPRSPCATFRCEYNTLRLINQECVNRAGQCKRVGAIWVESCVTYVCSTKKRNNKQEYQAVITNLACTDSNGRCRQPGSRFPFRIGSRVYPSCTCRSWLDHQRQKIKYFC